MKKTGKFITIILLCIVFLILIIYLKYISGWVEFRSNNYTLKENKLIVNVSRKQYSNDSLALVFKIKDRIKNHYTPYTNSVMVDGERVYINDSLTKIFIDTIFYSPNHNKLAFLVIVENKNEKYCMGMTKSEAEAFCKINHMELEGTFFDGNSFIAQRENNGFIASFYGYNFTNGNNYFIISGSLRNSCLNSGEVKVHNEVYYNLDDKRYWNSDSVWKVFK
ncbi:hypothetical protein ACG2LH_07110 [Zhouia sp. PK063]|uniref:hypothetical protein n=1 Tax=Zhouia sp. PK063 TaxID=3373602 RepID=UPI003798CFE5